jgi:hypothetical protein
MAFVSDKLHWRDKPGGVMTVELKTSRLFRDSSAWYHLVFIYNSSDGTSGDRAQIWINGVRETEFDTETYPTQHLDSVWNTTGVRAIGTYNTAAPEQSYDGYLSEVHFIDGTALDPTSFGETGTYGEWKPKEVTGLTYGNNGFYLSFAGGGIMSATGGNSTGTSGNYKYKTYTSNGTFTPSADGYVEYLVVGGGGGGGSRLGGGGGGGGFRTGYLQITGSTVYSVTVGDGGAYDATGDDSSISGTGLTTLTATGGGNGGAGNAYSAVGGSGGGGAGIGVYTGGAAGTSNQGYAGGAGAGSSGFAGAGGGGAAAVGANGIASGKAGDGGAGLQSNLDTNNYYYSGGGGGGAHFAPSTGAGDGGIGGGGGGARGGGSTDGGTYGNGTGGGSARNSGGSPADSTNQPGGAGGTNTGAGGGGAPNNADSGGAGGSGIVIIRYKFQ